MAVNLSGIEPSGNAIGVPRKSSEGPALHVTPSREDGATPHDHAPPQDGVSITSTASLLARLEHSLGAVPAVDQGRVDALRQALASGTYRVEPGKIADRLIQSERALGLLPRTEL